MSKIGIPKNITNTAALVELPQVTKTNIRGDNVLAVTETPAINYPLDLYFLNQLTTKTLASDTVVDTYTIVLTDASGVVAGNIIELADNTDGSIFMQATVLSISVNTLTVDSPINYPFVAANTAVVISRDNMNVDGSVTPVIFSIKPLTHQKGRFVRVLVVMTDDTVMDFETFGGLPALTRGLVLRINKGDGTYRNLGDFKSNGDLENYSFDARYFINNANNVRGFTGRITFGGQDNHGVVIALDGSLGEDLEIVVQDDLTGLLGLKWLAQGAEF